MTVVRIGNQRGKIALYLDAEEAIDMAKHYGPSDRVYTELVTAAVEAYPLVSHGTCTDCKRQDGPCWCGDTIGCTC